MKITIYTITACQFSKQEKEYLSSHGQQFEEKNLEINREFLTEMLAVGGNFAGTPVTKIEKDDGQIVVLKGFTAAEFDKTLGFAPAAEKVAAAPPAGEQPVVNAQPATQPEVVVPAPVPEVPMPPVQPEVSQAQVQTTDSAMASVLNTLEQQVQAVAAPTPIVETPVTPAVPPVPDVPVIPEPQF